MNDSLHSPSSRRAALAALGAGTLGLAAMPGFAAGPALPAAAVQLNVRDFGAIGDGAADDTAAFQRALAAARSPVGQCVRVPAGKYRITRSLTLESTLLLGLEAGGFQADTKPLPHIIVDVPAQQPCLIAKAGASVHGLELDFRRRPAAQVPRPDMAFGPGVKVAGAGVSLSNLLLHNPTQGIVADGSVNCGRMNLQNLFIVNPAEVGVRFEHAMDVVTFRNVHVWSYLPDSQRSCTGFLIGQVDEIRLTDCSVFAAAVGFHFVATDLPSGKRGSVWGGMNNCTVDFAATAVQVDHANILRISGGSFWSHHFGVVCDGPGDVLLSGADIRANSHQCVDVRGHATGTLTVNGCLLKRNAAGGQATMLNVSGPASVLVSGCQFQGASPGVLLSPAARCVGIMGNLFASGSHPAIVDKAPRGCVRLIANNLGAH